MRSQRPARPPRRPGTAGRCRGPRSPAPARAPPAGRRRSTSPTTSWPGTNGKLTIGSKQRRACRRRWPGRCRRSRPGGAGSAASPGPGSVGRRRRRRSRSGPTPAPGRPGDELGPASRAAANRGSDALEDASAFTVGHPLGAVPGRRVARCSRGRSGAADGRARRLGPVLDVPAPLAGDGGQLGLGVDGHRDADRLEHRQVAGRVGVGDGLAQVEAAGRGAVVHHDQGPGLARSAAPRSSSPVKRPSLARPGGRRRSRRTGAAAARRPSRGRR